MVLTRLISAIFRRATDPMFILEELHGIHDPNGGSFREGKYYHSFYAEVAETIERFFYDVGIISKNDHSESSSVKENFQKKEDDSLVIDPIDPIEPIDTAEENHNLNALFKICPDCSSKSLKTENGCDMCVECGYSKCDK